MHGLAARQHRLVKGEKRDRKKKKLKESPMRRFDAASALTVVKGLQNSLLLSVFFSF